MFGLIRRVPGHVLVENLVVHPIWTLRVGSVPRCASSVEWRPSRQRRMRRSERVWLDDRDPCEEITCMEILCITGEQGLMCIKHKVTGWDQLGSSEQMEEMFGCHIVRQLSNVQRSSCVWHHPQSERCERCCDEDWRRRTR